MIVVDSAIWIDHLHRREPALEELMSLRWALMHPFVLGEIALGSLRNRGAMLPPLRDLPQPPVADTQEVFNLIASANLAGSGIGYVDAHLIASTMLVPDGRLWTRDKRLFAVALRLGIEAD